ncbi:cilia- and flagella-associated protein 97 [Menidia menidia]
MFNPDELEGEVDHSFFDSDCEDSSRDGGKKVEKSLKTKKKNPTTYNKNLDDDSSPNTERREQPFREVENSKRSRASAVTSVSCPSGKVLSDSSEDDYNVLSKRSSGGFMALLVDTKEGEDVCNPNPNESGDKATAFGSSSKKKIVQSPRKLVKSQHHRTPSPTSNEASADADSEGSGSSQSGNMGSSALHKPTKSSSNPAVRRNRAGSAGSRDLLSASSDESDDSVTDVSPLSSPEFSPLQSLDLTNTEAKERNHEEHQRESVPSSGLSNIKQEEDSDQDLDDRSFSLESELGSKLVFHGPGGRNRKNYSFSNDEVWRIDRENQRLLRELSRLSPGPRPASAVGKKTHVANSSPLVRLSHSALNRKREQQRIERDNLAFLKRLESVKPTHGLRRSEQLADYQRHAGYLGGPSYPICTSSARKDRLSSRKSSASVDSRSIGSKTVLTDPESSSTPVPSSTKLNAVRPAWC